MPSREQRHACHRLQPQRQAPWKRGALACLLKRLTIRLSKRRLLLSTSLVKWHFNNTPTKTGCGRHSAESTQRSAVRLLLLRQSLPLLNHCLTGRRGLREVFRFRHTPSSSAAASRHFGTRTTCGNQGSTFFFKACSIRFIGCLIRSKGTGANQQRRQQCKEGSHRLLQGGKG